MINLIISGASSYSEKQLYPFVASAAQSGMPVDLVFIRSIDDPALDFSGLDLQNLLLHEARRKFRRIKRGERQVGINLLLRAACLLPVASRRAFLPLLHIAVGRIALAMQLINEYPDAQNILLCDSRDAVFQSDPFAGMHAGSGVILSEEDAVIENEPTNRYWLDRLSLPAADFDQFRRLPTLCSGAILGRRDALLHFLHEFNQALLKHVPQIRTDGGFDQAVMNVVARTQNVPDVHIHPSGVPPLVHIGSRWHEHFVLDKNQGLLTKKNEVVPFVHQYDRHPELIRHFMERFSSQ